MRIVVLFVCLSAAYSLQAQYAWFTEIPGSGYVGAESLSIDPDDNLLVTGNFDNGVTVGGNTYTGRGSFLLKLSKNGTPIWHRIFRYGAGDFWQLIHVGTDASGNAYIAGTFPGSITGTGFGFNLSAPFAYSGFVAKLDKHGDVQWTKVIPNVQEFYDMKVNDAGNILLYAHHYQSVVIDNVTLDVGTNSFGIMLNSSGTLQWAKTLGDPQHYTTWPRACAIDNNGNAYFHGLFSGTLSLDGHQVTSTGGNFNFFVTRMNTQGTCQWITPIDRKLPAQFETTNPPSGLIVERGAIAVDQNENLYLAGQYWEGIKAGTLSLSGGGSCLAKFTAAGEPVWLKSRANSAHNSTVDDVLIHNNLIYFSGLQPSQFHFSVYTTDGDVAQPTVMIPLFGDIASGLGVDSQNQVYMSGRHYDTQNLQGFVFKYGISNPLPVAAGAISGPSVVCVSQTDVVFSTPVIAYAETYEWEIIDGANRYTFETTDPQLTITLSAYSLDEDFTIHVRGTNASGVGAYSSERTITRENPLTAPTLVASCSQISFTKSDTFTDVAWYFNNTVAGQLGESSSITPSNDGDYFVVVSNTCGSATSNVVAFAPLNADDLEIPNIITPNGDDFNQKFVVDAKLESPALIVYNRWGQRVYASEQYANTWSGDNLSEGVYYYKLNSGCLSNLIQGTITIAR